MKRFYLIGRAKDVFRERDFLTKMHKATSHVLVRYQAKPQTNSQN